MSAIEGYFAEMSRRAAEIQAEARRRIREASEIQVAEWVEAGRRDSRALEIAWHAIRAAEFDGTADDCPFDAAAPGSCERWKFFFATATRARAARKAAATRAVAQAQADGLLF